jgi:hypothetical protein
LPAEAEVPIYRSLPAGIPRWAARRAHVAAALLRGWNAYRRHGKLLLLSALLVMAAACGLAAVPQVDLILGWLGRNVFVTFILAVCLFGLSTIRRRERAAVAAASSWLAALPVPSSVSLDVMAGTGARLLLVILFAALASLLGRLDADAAWRLALAVCAGAAGGSLAGWRLRLGADDGAPGFHYATVRRARRRWAAAPTLLPLAYWPAAQGRIFSRPKMMSRVAFISLMTLPLGTPGQVALAIVAAAIATFSIASLSLAAIRVAFAAARWLAPTTLRRGRFTAAIVWRVLLRQALSMAAMVFLACAIDLPQALRLGVALASGFLGVSLAVAAVACGCACLCVGLGAVSRGAVTDELPAA